MFPNERGAVPGCVFNETPEDASKILNENQDSPNFNTPIGTVSEMLSDFANFAAFMRLSAPPAPGPSTQSTQNGANLSAASAALCATPPRSTTADSSFTGMGGVTYKPYSDFALHHMGRGLADGINQGRPGRISSARLRYGASASVCSFFTTDVPPTCCKRSRITVLPTIAGTATSSTVVVRKRRGAPQFQDTQPNAGSGSAEFSAVAVETASGFGLRAASEHRSTARGPVSRHRSLIARLHARCAQFRGCQGTANSGRWLTLRARCRAGARGSRTPPRNWAWFPGMSDEEQLGPEGLREPRIFALIV